MQQSYLYSCILGYLAILLTIAYFSSKKSNMQDYFVGSNKANWFLVSFGMISDLLSGVTYVSVPGLIATNGISYFFVALGHVFGNIFLAYFVLPHFYKKKIISIYEVLQNNLGREASVICSVLFLIARSFGAAARLFLSLILLYKVLELSTLFSFPVLCFIVIAIIYLYTIKGGIKSLIFTDIYHSALLLLGFLSIFYFLQQNVEVFAFVETLQFPLDNFMESNNFIKSFVGGIFITIAMYGLDQNMMQKNLSCPDAKSAQKNVLLTTLFALILNVCFILVGLLLLPNYQHFQLTVPLSPTGSIQGDQLLINLTQAVAPEWIMALFIIGLLAATFSSSDGVITTLTTSFYRDLVPEKLRVKFNIKYIHGTMAVILLSQLLILATINSTSMIGVILKVSSYIYAPLIAIFTLYLINIPKPPKMALSLSTVITLACSYPLVMMIESNSNYKFGLEVLAFNTGIFLIIFSVLRKGLK